MDTKSKKFSQLTGVRIIAFILCVCLFVTTLVSLLLMSVSFRNLNYVAGASDLFQKNTYEESADMQYEFSEKLYHITNMLDEYKSEEYITSGKTISDSQLEDAIRNLFYNGEYSYEGNVIVSNDFSMATEPENYMSILGRALDNGVISSEAYEAYRNSYENGAPLSVEELGILEDSEEYVDKSDFGDPAVREAFIAANAEQIGQIKKNMIKDDLRAFQQKKKNLDKVDGFTYYATDGTYTVTNMERASGSAVTAEQFRNNPAYLVYENDSFEKVPPSNRIGGWVMNLDQEMESTLDSFYNDNLTVYMGFDNSFIAAKQADYTAAKSEMIKWFPVVCGAALLCLILLIWLMVTTGGRGPDGTRKLYKLDKVWTEVLIAGVVASICLGVVISVETAFGYYGGSYYYSSTYGYMMQELDIPIFEIALSSIGTAAFAALGLWCLLAGIRLLKAGLFLKNSLIYKLLAAIGKAFMTVYKGGSVMRKVVLVALAVCLLSATVFLAPVVFVVILVFAPRWVKRYEAVKTGVEEVKSGNLSYKIQLSGSGELDDLARGINEISEASNIAVQNELKNQRMKTELISNVSHDLKTPLTSMVTYIDLLKTEGLESPNAPEYLEVLDQKTNRLRQLTEDLFEAAKASSGAIPVRMEKVEMLSLINQGMGEFDQKIQESKLDFILNAPEEKYYVWADGQLLWRVVENLFSNALKYAQEGTRVYINLSEQGGSGGEATMVVLEVKNISKQALNIDANELMERFKRGDESRTTEGSGLGLAIAKDLVKLQNGWFEIKIDGDLFKATVMLNKYVKEQPETGEQ